MTEPVSWYAIRPGWRVATLDGDVLGQVEEVLGDEELDIFSGLVVRRGIGRAPRHLDASLVRTIEPGEVLVELEVDADDAAR